MAIVRKGHQVSFNRGNKIIPKKPDGIKKGDLIVIGFSFKVPGSGYVAVTPKGFNSVGSYYLSNSTANFMCYKIASDNESYDHYLSIKKSGDPSIESSYVETEFVASCAVYDNVSNQSPFIGGLGTSGNSLGSISGVVPGSLLVVATSIDSFVLQTIPGMTRYVGSGYSDVPLALGMYEQIYSTTGSTETKTASNSSSRAINGMLFTPNDRPEFSNISAPTSIKWTDSATVSGKITDADGDTVRYRISVNGKQFYPSSGWSSYFTSGKTFSHTIPAGNLKEGSNTVLIEAEDSDGKLIETTKTITQVNNKPVISNVIISPTSIVSREDATITGRITDSDNDSARYKISVNGIQVFPSSGWSDFYVPGYNFSYTIPSSAFKIGSNTVTIEAEDQGGKAASPISKSITQTYKVWNLNLLQNNDKILSYKDGTLSIVGDAPAQIEMFYNDGSENLLPLKRGEVSSEKQK